MQFFDSYGCKFYNMLCKLIKWIKHFQNQLCKKMCEKNLWENIQQIAFSFISIAKLKNQQSIQLHAHVHTKAALDTDFTVN